MFFEPIEAAWIVVIVLPILACAGLLVSFSCLIYLVYRQRSQTTPSQADANSTTRNPRAPPTGRTISNAPGASHSPQQNIEKHTLKPHARLSPTRPKNVHSPRRGRLEIAVTEISAVGLTFKAPHAADSTAFEAPPLPVVKLSGGGLPDAVYTECGIESGGVVYWPATSASRLVLPNDDNNTQDVYIDVIDVTDKSLGRYTLRSVAIRDAARSCGVLTFPLLVACHAASYDADSGPASEGTENQSWKPSGCNMTISFVTRPRPRDLEAIHPFAMLGPPTSPAALSDSTVEGKYANLSLAVAPLRFRCAESCGVPTHGSAADTGSATARAVFILGRYSEPHRRFVTSSAERGCSTAKCVFEWLHGAPSASVLPLEGFVKRGTLNISVVVDHRAPEGDSEALDAEDENAFLGRGSVDIRLSDLILMRGRHEVNVVILRRDQALDTWAATGQLTMVIALEVDKCFVPPVARPQSALSIHYRDASPPPVAPKSFRGTLSPNPLPLPTTHNLRLRNIALRGSVPKGLCPKVSLGFLAFADVTAISEQVSMSLPSAVSSGQDSAAVTWHGLVLTMPVSLPRHSQALLYPRLAVEVDGIKDASSGALFATLDMKPFFSSRRGIPKEVVLPLFSMVGSQWRNASVSIRLDIELQDYFDLVEPATAISAMKQASSSTSVTPAAITPSTSTIPTIALDGDDRKSTPEPELASTGGLLHDYLLPEGESYGLGQSVTSTIGDFGLSVHRADPRHSAPSSPRGLGESISSVLHHRRDKKRRDKKLKLLDIPFSGPNSLASSRHESFQNLPAGPVAVIVVDIPGSTVLWHNIRRVTMRHSRRLLQLTVRGALEAIGSTVVLCEGESMVFICPDLVAASKASALLHLTLLDAEWHSTLLECPEAAPRLHPTSTQPIWKGLPVRVGLHVGELRERSVDHDSEEHIVDDPIVKHAAAVAAMAQAGETLLTKEAQDCILSTIAVKLEDALDKQSDHPVSTWVQLARAGKPSETDELQPVNRPKSTSELLVFYPPPMRAHNHANFPDQSLDDLCALLPFSLLPRFPNAFTADTPTLRRESITGGHMNKLNLAAFASRFLSRKSSTTVVQASAFSNHPAAPGRSTTDPVTLVFTDVQSSTNLWNDIDPVVMLTALQAHNNTCRRLIRLCGGYEVKTEGDAFMIAFATPEAAISWCIAAQLALLYCTNWPEELYNLEFCRRDDVNCWGGFRVRMGIHTGIAIRTIDPVTSRYDFFGPMVNKAARVSAHATGGVIVCSKEVANLLWPSDVEPCIQRGPGTVCAVRQTSVPSLGPQIAGQDRDSICQIVKGGDVGIQVTYRDYCELKGFSYKEPIFVIEAIPLLARSASIGRCEAGISNFSIGIDPLDVIQDAQMSEFVSGLQSDIELQENQTMATHDRDSGAHVKSTAAPAAPNVTPHTLSTAPIKPPIKEVSPPVLDTTELASLSETVKAFSAALRKQATLVLHGSDTDALQSNRMKRLEEAEKSLSMQNTPAPRVGSAPAYRSHITTPSIAAHRASPSPPRSAGPVRAASPPRVIPVKYTSMPLGAAPISNALMLSYKQYSDSRTGTRR